MARALRIWTIGHSNHPLERFLAMLAEEQIEFLVDVRSYPYSRFAPQFSREDLAASLAPPLRYVFMGEELGGRPSRPEHYDADGHALYGAMARADEFQGAIDRLIDGARLHRIALMCSEGRPADCHRRLLVGKVLTGRGLTLRHMLPDGSVTEEDEVKLAAAQSQDQEALFSEDREQWRSTQSVSRRRRLATSSTG
jgi:uncharacterized protein (DUF488 family)